MIFVIFLEHTFVSLTLKLNNMKKLITSVLALTAVAFSYAQNYNEVSQVGNSNTADVEQYGKNKNYITHLGDSNVATVDQKGENFNWGKSTGDKNSITVDQYGKDNHN